MSKMIYEIHETVAYDITWQDVQRFITANKLLGRKVITVEAVPLVDIMSSFVVNSWHEVASIIANHDKNPLICRTKIEIPYHLFDGSPFDAVYFEGHVCIEKIYEHVFNTQLKDAIYSSSRPEKSELIMRTYRCKTKEEYEKFLVDYEEFKKFIMGDSFCELQSEVCIFDNNESHDDKWIELHKGIVV